MCDTQAQSMKTHTSQVEQRSGMALPGEGGGIRPVFVLKHAGAILNLVSEGLWTLHQMLLPISLNTSS